jgi:hypothetical protein
MTLVSAGLAGRFSQLRIRSVGMLRFLLPATAPAVAALALVAAGCSYNGGQRASTTAKSSAPCKLDKAQLRTVALARADIRRLRRIQAPVQSFSQRGAPGQEALTGKFLLDLGSTKLPLNVFSHLLHQAKAATSLCGDCGSGLETEEPVLGNRGLSHGVSCG